MKKAKLIVYIAILLLLTVTGCQEKKFYLKTENITCFELYENISGEYILVGAVDDKEQDFKECLEQARKVRFENGSSFEGKSEFYIRIKYVDGSWDDINEFKIIRYDKNGLNYELFNYQCSSDLLVKLREKILQGGSND